MKIDLDGKVALITGAAGGLGKAIARAFAKAGARLVLCDINEEALGQTSEEIRQLGAPCLAARCDVSSSNEVSSTFKRACDHFGALHVLVNNAAVIPAGRDDEESRNKHYAYLTTPMPRRSLGFTSNMSDKDWLRFWDVNVHGLFYCTREALRRMEPQRQGKIINVASVAGLSAYGAHSPHYSATKGAVIAFTRSVAAEVAGANIFVNAIAPWWCPYRVVRSLPEQNWRRKAESVVPTCPIGQTWHARGICVPCGLSRLRRSLPGRTDYQPKRRDVLEEA
jgi:3-oxoacyl-[acyl-carrier protein] reductase